MNEEISKAKVWNTMNGHINKTKVRILDAHFSQESENTKHYDSTF